MTTQSTLQTPEALSSKPDTPPKDSPKEYNVL